MPRKLDKWVYVKKDWNRGEFLREVDAFDQLRPAVSSAQPDREAYQIIYDLCEVLEDMVLSGADRFEKLMTSARTPGEWRSLIQSLLSRKKQFTVRLAQPEQQTIKALGVTKKYHSKFAITLGTR